MILQSLASYYDRKRELDPHELPPPGYEENAISFVVVLDLDGRLVNLEDWREGEGKRKHGKAQFVPQSKDRTGKDSWKTAFLLWDHPRYVFGVPKDGEDRETSQSRLETFRRRIKQSFPDPSVDNGVNAVVRFYDRTDAFSQLHESALWPQVEEGNGNVSFRLRDSTELVCQSTKVRETLAGEFKMDSGVGVRQCLISGHPETIERLHPATPIPDSKSTAKIHSFNLPAFNSYGKEQGANAPVGKRASFAYTSALNYLLGTRNRQNHKQYLRVGDASAVFWADRSSALEDNCADIFDEPSKDDPDLNARAIKALYEAPRHGVAPIKDNQTRFYVLGLGPNAARIAIRFWHVGTVAELAKNILKHFDDLAIVRPSFEKPHLSLFRLLLATAAQGKRENIPPNLGGEVMRAILECLPYPVTLLQGAVRRIRAEQEVSYPRAAIVKACLNRIRQIHEKELTMSLDEDNTDVAYLLGRLFFVLEEAQWAAHSTKTNPGTNSTIRDRFYGAASATPITVFPQLLRLYPHHISKAAKSGRKGIAVCLEKLVDGITTKLPAKNPFPSYMAVSEQGRFAVGYYHQRHDFFSSNQSA
ncbi:MAG: CRISPR-associated protein, Csd1 family [Nitrospira sp.]|jgi:CRISPR-associated protein Csd1|nr:MAG: CRISPR-associated protein, Csd1 family [Nitrospira sp.]